MGIAAQKGHMDIVYLLLDMDGIKMDGFRFLGGGKNKNKNKKNKNQNKNKKTRIKK